MKQSTRHTIPATGIYLAAFCALNLSSSATTVSSTVPATDSVLTPEMTAPICTVHHEETAHHRCSQCEREKEREGRIVQAAVAGAVNIVNAMTSVAVAKQNDASPEQQQAIVVAGVSTIMGSIANILLASTRAHDLDLPEHATNDVDLDPITALRYTLTVPRLRHALEQAIADQLMNPTTD